MPYNTKGLRIVDCICFIASVREPEGWAELAHTQPQSRVSTCLTFIIDAFPPCFLHCTLNNCACPINVQQTYPLLSALNIFEVYIFPTSWFLFLFAAPTSCHFVSHPLFPFSFHSGDQLTENLFKTLGSTAWVEASSRPRPRFLHRLIHGWSVMSARPTSLPVPTLICGPWPCVWFPLESQSEKKGRGTKRKPKKSKHSFCRKIQSEYANQI